MADEAEAMSRARKASSFDYKMTASVGAETFKGLVKRLDKGCGCNIMKMRDGQVHEVPDRTCDGVDCGDSRFMDCGIALKSEWDGDGVRYYLFYVFTVRYSGVKFADGNGVLNQMGINRIFAVDPDASAGHVEYFRKDHERIIAAANAFDVYNALSKDGNKAEVNPCLRNLFEQMDFAVCCGDDESPGCGKMVEHFDLTTAEFGPVEMRIVQKLML